MSTQTKAQTTSLEPPVVLDRAYAERLHGLASAVRNRLPHVADRLMREVERARVLPSAELPENIVNIGSEVTFLDHETGAERTVTLVFPPDADIALGRVSVLTPVGAALIGLAVGHSIDWETHGGRIRRLTVARVGRGAAGA